jgi:hypothetical protein
MKIALITGASSGIGMEMARQIDDTYSSIQEIWLVARREDRLEKLAGELHKSCRILVANLSTEAGINTLKQELETVKPKVCILGNCAGYGKLGSVDALSMEHNTGMVQLNCVTLTSVTKLVLPYIVKGTMLIHMASSAAFLPQRNFAVYAASKSYVLSFTRALREELRPQGIRVTAVCPGPVKTEFFDIAEEGQNIMWYKKLIMADCPDVVRQALADASHGKALSIYGIPMKLFYLVTKLVPHRIILRMLTLLNGVK